MNRDFLQRVFWCLTPYLAAFLLPPALALWVESHRFQLTLAAALQAVVADYSRPYGDGLWSVTFYHLPPFFLLSVILALLARRLSWQRLAALSLSVLTLICLVQIPLTIRALKDISAGEAEFVQFRYMFISALSVVAVIFGLFVTRPIHTDAPITPLK